MAVVALGHWLGTVVVLRHGKLDGGNLLDVAPEYGWITWIGQVMPLFFFVGGFASATSLRSAERRGVRPADWIATRLRRMVAPAAALATFWAAVLVLGAAGGGAGIVGIAAAGAVYGALAARLRSGTTLLPLLLLPLLAPVLIGATRGFEVALGREAGPGWPWVALLGIFAVVYLTLGALLFRPLLEDA